MIDFFTPVAGDESLGYLANIFGNMEGVLPSGGSLTILGAMFYAFNSIALVVGALIVAYITIVGVMMTAHEGEFMKKWNSLWTPLRAVLGIAALVPTSSGFCGIQILMMWVIVQGVGAADTVWNTALVYLSTFNSPTAQVTVGNPAVSTYLANLFPALVCEASAYSQNAPPVVYSQQTGGYYCYQNNDSWCSNPLPTLNSSQSTLSFGPGGACGSVSYCDGATLCAGAGSSSLECMACQAQQQVLDQQVIPVMRQIAAYFVNADYQYQNYYSNGSSMAGGQITQNFPPPDWVAQYCQAEGVPSAQCVGPLTDALTGEKLEGPLHSLAPGSGSGSVPNGVVDALYWPYAIKPQYAQGTNSNFLTTVASQYSAAIQTAVVAYMTQAALNNPGGAVSGAYSNAQQAGWVFAGAYYYEIAQQNKVNLQSSWPDFSVALPSPLPTAPASVLYATRNNFTAAQELVNQITGVGAGSSSSVMGGTASVGNSAISSINQSLASATQPGVSNALIALAQAGYALLTAAQIIFLILLVVVLVIGLTSGIDVFVLGTGVTDPLSWGWLFTWMLLVPAFLALMGLMVTMGGLMGVYVPLMPFIVFTFGAIGWFIATIEAIAAGPLVALGILAPGGHHEILGKAEPALMLLFGIFLRPTFMVVGLIAAMLLANTVVVPMINGLFWTAVTQIGNAALPTAGPGSGGATLEASPLESILFLCGYVSMIIAALGKCFELIHIIPDRALTWIGGQATSYGGEGEALGAVKGGVDSGAGTARGAMEGGAKTTSVAAAGAGGRKLEQKQANQPKVEPDSTPPPPSNNNNNPPSP